MEKVKLSKELDEKIVKYLEENTPVKFDWGYQESLSKEQVAKMLESEDGLMDLEMELYDMNIDYAFELEDELVRSAIDRFREELAEELNCEEDEVEDAFDFREEYLDYLSVDVNVQELVDNVGNLTCLIYLYSNYDCTNSFDTMEDSSYLQQVYQRVKKGVREDDFMWEHINGAYGGSLFCFAFQCSITELIELKKQLKTGKQIFIPKGTQFGYFSSFQGAGSVFEKTTYKDFYLNIKEEGNDFNPDYDNVDIIADVEQSYSMSQVYGSNDFINEQGILIK